MRALAKFILISALTVVSACGERDFSAARIQADLNGISNALKFYKLDCGSYPTDELGLTVLLNPSGDSCDSRLNRYVSQLPNDPWGNSYSYRKVSENSFELASLGRDGKEGGYGSSKDILLKTDESEN